MNEGPMVQIAQGSAYGSKNAFPAGGGNSIIDVQIRRIHGNQERIFRLTQELASVADTLMGSPPPPVGSQTNGAGVPQSPAKVNALALANDGINEALDRLEAQVERFKIL